MFVVGEAAAVLDKGPGDIVVGASELNKSLSPYKIRILILQEPPHVPTASKHGDQAIKAFGLPRQYQLTAFCCPDPDL